MLTRIVYHEWLALKADRTVWVVGLVFAAAIGYGVWTGVQWVAFERGAIAEARQEEQERYERLEAQVKELARTGASVSPFTDPRSPAAVGLRLGPRYATLPPAPLAALAIGQSDLLPSYIRISTDTRENVVAATELDNPQRLLLGRFDLAFVLTYLYPLLILGVTYNMLSSEKEQGTLALALSQPVGLGTLVAGKVLLRAILLVGLVLGCSVAALILSGVPVGATGAATRVLLWMATVGAYGAFWFALAVVVAALGRPSAVNATILSSIWLVVVILLPSTMNLGVTTAYPVPSRVEMIQAMRAASDVATAAGSQVLARYYEDHPELATGDAQQAMTDVNITRVAVNADVERQVRPVIDHFEQQVERQQRAVNRLKVLSPAVLLQDALNDLSGTGTARHRDFMAQVDRFHREWRAFFTPLILRKAALESYDRVPRYTYSEESTAALAFRVGTDLMLLLLPTALLLWIGARRLPRYPIASA